MIVSNQSKIENKCIHLKTRSVFNIFLQVDLHSCENKFIDIQEYFIDNSGVDQNTFLSSCQKLYILGNCVLIKFHDFTLAESLKVMLPDASTKSVHLRLSFMSHLCTVERNQKTNKMQCNPISLFQRLKATANHRKSYLANEKK